MGRWAIVVGLGFMSQELGSTPKGLGPKPKGLRAKSKGLRAVGLAFKPIGLGCKPMGLGCMPMEGRELSGLGNRGGFIGVGVGQGLLNERMQFGHNSRGLGCKLVEKQRPQGLLQGHGGLILSPFCLEQSSI
jgi:hypothetical protein